MQCCEPKCHFECVCECISGRAGYIPIRRLQYRLLLTSASIKSKVSSFSCRPGHLHCQNFTILLLLLKLLLGGHLEPEQANDIRPNTQITIILSPEGNVCLTEGNHRVEAVIINFGSV